MEWNLMFNLYQQSVLLFGRLFKSDGKEINKYLLY